MRAVLQLSHGMVEFIDRYKPLAEYLAARGILVTGNDHLGHGGSIRTKEDYGYFGEPDGNRAVLEDLHAVTVPDKAAVPGRALFPAGAQHGLVLRPAVPLCEWGGELDGAIIMGTGFQPKALVQLAKTICRVLAVFHGWHYRSKLVARPFLYGVQQGAGGPHHPRLAQPRSGGGGQVSGRRALHLYLYAERLLQHVQRHPAPARPGFSGTDAQRAAAAVPGRRCRPGGRTGQGRAARHPEPEGCRCAEHLQAVPRCPA